MTLTKECTGPRTVSEISICKSLFLAPKALVCFQAVQQPLWAHSPHMIRLLLSHCTLENPKAQIARGLAFTAFAPLAIWSERSVAAVVVICRPVNGSLPAFSLSVTLKRARWNGPTTEGHWGGGCCGETLGGLKQLLLFKCPLSGRTLPHHAPSSPVCGGFEIFISLPHHLLCDTALWISSVQIKRPEWHSLQRAFGSRSRRATQTITALPLMYPWWIWSSFIH